MFAEDQRRMEDFCHRLGGILCDFSKQGIDRAALAALLDLAQAAGTEEAVSQLLDGAIVNRSENRAALHPVMRAAHAGRVAVLGAREAVALAAVDEQMRALVQRLRDRTSAPLDTVVNIGIGGSDYGPRLLADALGDGVLNSRFLSTPDEHAWTELVATLDPLRTGFVLVSKSFTTPETLLNAHRARAWLRQSMGADAASERLWAVTAAPDVARGFGISKGHVLAMADGVGGRYSVWSSAGLSAAIAMGWDAFQALRAGAAQVDDHVRSTPLAQNIPVLMALLDFWHRVLCACPVRVAAVYDVRLRHLPGYLQQLEMESNGKGVSVDGQRAVPHSGAALLGGLGPDCQHSFFQALHQGSSAFPVDFIGVASSGDGDTASRHGLLANMLAQSAALMQGHQSSRPQQACPGNRSSSTFLLAALTPTTLGQLLALYEHKVYVLAHLLDINPFDQFGVELGKRLAAEIEPMLAGTGSAPAPDPSSARLIAEIRKADSR